MTPDKCPGCGARLEPDMAACPNCPMSFPDGEGAAGSANPLKETRLYQFLLPALFFAALAGGVWWMGSGLFHLATASENGNLDSPLLKKLAKQEAADEAADRKAKGGGARAAGDAAAPGADGTASGDSAADAGDSGGTVIISPLEQQEPPPRSQAVLKEWKLRGNVYDLTSLRPLAGVSVTFVDEQTNEQRRTRTDSTGLYRIILPPLQDRGYTIFVEKAGYGGNYLDPATPGVRDLDAVQRRALAKGLSETLTATPISVTGAPGPVVTDFFLAPRP